MKKAIKKKTIKKKPVKKRIKKAVRKKPIVKEKLPVNLNDNWQSLSKLIIDGDLSSLTDKERVLYYHSYCNMLGINPLAKPFDYIVLNNKLVLYANKGCAEQLRKLHRISILDCNINIGSDVVTCIVKGQNKSGRMDSSTGVVNIKGFSGDRLANAIMKSETKAKRRLTLSLCGLNMVDETELETIQGLKQAKIDMTTHQIKDVTNQQFTKEKYDSVKNSVDDRKWHDSKPIPKDIEIKKELDKYEKLNKMPDALKKWFREYSYTRNMVYDQCENLGINKDGFSWTTVEDWQKKQNAENEVVK